MTTRAEARAFHLISAHMDVIAIIRSPALNADVHHEEHYGPCGIRNHDYADLSFDERVVEAVLEEVEGAEDT